MEEMFELADRLRALREDKQSAEQQVKAITDEIDEVNYRLSEMMAETETQNFTRSGIMFYLISKTMASATAARKDELYAALKREGYGEMITETINANSLSAFVKEQITENDDALPGWLNGLVNVFEKTTVGVKRAAK